MLIGLDGGIKICDFDLSREKETASALMTSVVGTRLWMAPEQLRGEFYKHKVFLLTKTETTLGILLSKVDYIFRIVCSML